MRTCDHLRQRAAVCLLAALLLTVLAWAVSSRFAPGRPAVAQPQAVAQVLIVDDPAHPGGVRLQGAPDPSAPDAVPAVLRLPAGGASLLGADRAGAVLGAASVLVLGGAVVAAGGLPARGSRQARPA